MSTRRRGAAAALGLVAALALAGCAQDSFAQSYAANPEQGYVAGDGSWQVIPAADRKPPVEYSGTTEGGDTLSSSDTAGEVVVMNFWYAGCPPCRAEARDLEALNQSFSEQSVQFVGVNVYDQPATIDSFNAEFGVTYPSILDVQQAAVRLAFSDNVSPQAIPSTLVIDRQGRVAAVVRGLADPSVLTTMIQDVLAEASS